MTTIVVKKEREGCKIFPLKRQKNTDQGELVPPGIRFFSGKGGRVPPHLYKTTTFRGRLPCHSLSPGPDQPVTKNLCRCSIPCNVHRYAAGRWRRASDRSSIIYPKTGKTKPKTKERTLS